MGNVLHAPAAPVDPDLDIDLARQVALDAVHSAGALLRRGVHGDLGLRGKGSAGDVVTDLDVCAERLILRRIRAAFPDHRIIAEEAGVLETTGTAWTWLVDPLDGTNNLAVALPAYVVGVARGDIDGMVGYHPEEVDRPAGALIAAEAGIAVYGLDGELFDQRIGRPQVDRSFVACRPEHIDRLLGLVHAA